jgi:hypothetical protein
MQKSCKGNIVDAQVSHKCISPLPISHGGEWLLFAWFAHLYVLSCPILPGRFCL